MAAEVNRHSVYGSPTFILLRAHHKVVAKGLNKTTSIKGQIFNY